MPGVDEHTAKVTRTMHATPAEVWAVLADGWVYPTWVVGASRMRAVDESWPETGSRLHHSVGVWPMLLDDKTEVLEAVPQQRLRLEAHGWPFGTAEVLIELEPVGAETVVHIKEDALSGPAVLMPKPLRQAAVVPRNRETLRRLAFLAEGR